MKKKGTFLSYIGKQKQSAKKLIGNTEVKHNERSVYVSDRSVLLEEPVEQV